MNLRLNLSVIYILFTILLLIIVLGYLFFDTINLFRSISILSILSNNWNPSQGQFGISAFLLLSLLLVLLVLITAFPISVIVSLFIAFYIKSDFIKSIIKSIIDAFYYIPALLVGLWALVFFIPIVSKLFSSISIDYNGYGLFSAAIVLSVAILPFLISRNLKVIYQLDRNIFIASISLGSTNYEIIKNVILPLCSNKFIANASYAAALIMSEIVLSSIILGNGSDLPNSIFSETQTLSTTIIKTFDVNISKITSSVLSLVALLVIIFCYFFVFIGNKLMSTKK